MGFTDGVVILVQCIWGACEYFIKSKMTATGDNADQKSYKILYTITIISLILGISIGMYFKFNNMLGLYNPSNLYPIVGSMIIVAGMIVRLSAINTLKEYFTINVTIKADHKLITGGLYRLIRHPAYAGGVLSFIGCGLCYGNLLSFFIISLPYFILILIRIKYEESLLVNKFGNEYTELQSRTKKLIPYLY
jgi:protein-S-isoprenylcysteine O-methyltransferase Ste14